MQSYRQHEFKKPRQNNLTNNLDSSMISCKSKNSFRDLNDYRNFTPLDRQHNDQHHQESACKIKQMLNNLVQADNGKQPTQLFGQSLREKKNLDSKSTRGDSIYSKTGQSISQIAKVQMSKTPKQNESTPKPVINTPNSTRELNQNNPNLSNLYYMFQNKQSDPQIKQNVMTLSQLAKQNQQQKANASTTPQRNGAHINTQNDYISQIQQLKQKIENSSQRKPSPKLEKYQNQNSSQLIKNLTSQINKKTQQQNDTQKILQKSEEISDKIVELILQKEQLWNQIYQTLDNIDLSILRNVCSQLQQILNQLAEKKNSEYLYGVDINIIDTFLLESFTILIVTIEILKTKENFDQNLKNLVIYITQSNFYLIQTVNQAVVHVYFILNIYRIYQNSELRQGNFNRKNLRIRPNRLCKKIILQQDQYQNQCIDDTSHPEIYSQLGFNSTSLDLYFIQQKKILNLIAKETTQSENHSNQSSNQNSNQSSHKSLKIMHQQKKNLLPPKPIKNYTLVLDLDETLVHYQEFPNGGGQFLVRPFAEEFLEKLSKYYEIVIFTAAQSDYANFIIDIIDKQKIVTARLYREHTLLRENVYIKDLSILGRNLSKVIIVDNMPENFQLQPENGIFIQSWTGDLKDRALKDLMPLLEQIANKKVKDVREALSQFREQMIEKVQQGVKNPYQNLQLV